MTKDARSSTQGAQGLQEGSKPRPSPGPAIQPEDLAGVTSTLWDLDDGLYCSSASLRVTVVLWVIKRTT